jgi:hypothetical protein
MKSLFHRKASITSSSGSSFSNASHYSQNSLALSNHVASGSSKQHLQGTTMTSTRQPPSRRAISPETSRDPPESEMDQDNDIITDNCPVCVEDLKMKLMGEKPLVIPKCGHRLRQSESSFSTLLLPHVILVSSSGVSSTAIFCMCGSTALE